MSTQTLEGGVTHVRRRPWQEAAIASESTLYLTAREAKDLSEAMHRLLEPYRERWDDAALRPPGSLPHEVLVFGYPLTDPPGSPEPTAASGDKDQI